LPLSRLHERSCSDDLKSLAELGYFGITLQQSVGGAELSAVEEAMIFDRLGRQLVTPSAVASALAARLALEAREEGIATAIVAGDRTVAFATEEAGDGSIVIYDGERSELVLLVSRQKISLIAGTAVTEERWIDKSQWSLPLKAARIRGTPVFPGSSSLRNRFALLCAAQSSGIAAAARDMAVAYAGIRKQFGKPIGAFQAVKHHCADMATAAMAAADLLTFAAVAVADERNDAAFQCQAALNVALRAARNNAALNIQVHGGIGFSDECDAHLLLKRSHVWEAISQESLLSEPFPLRVPRKVLAN
jgi:alkylation response protein AidB-like acyl-CoA dehydrogenase